MCIVPTMQLYPNIITTQTNEIGPYDVQKLRKDECNNIITSENRQSQPIELITCVHNSMNLGERLKIDEIEVLLGEISQDYFLCTSYQPDQAETLLHSLERAAASIGLYVNAHKTEYMCYNQTGDISTLEGTPLKLVDKFPYLGSSVGSTEKDIETRLTKAWTAINRLSIIWKSDLTDKMKRSFFQAAVTSILLYGCTTWTLTKRLEKKLDGNYIRMLRAILNKSWQQHPTRHQLYGHLPPITKTIQVRRTRHAGHCWRSRDELIRDVLLWIPTHGRAKAGRPARTYIQQLCEDTGCCPEDLPRAMNDRVEWRERVRDIRATSAIWWWLLWNKLYVTLQLLRRVQELLGWRGDILLATSSLFKFSRENIQVRNESTLPPGTYFLFLLDGTGFYIYRLVTRFLLNLLESSKILKKQ